MKSLPELDTNQYIKLAIEGIHKLLGEDATRGTLEEYTDFLKSPEGVVFITGYILGNEYTACSIANVGESTGSMSDILIKQYFEEALSNG